MKNLKILALAFFAVLMINSCSKQEQADLIESIDQGGMLKSAKADIPIFPEVNVTWPADPECSEAVYDLFGGQTILMGTVSVITDGGDLFVKYELNKDHKDAGCKITEVHLYVGPQDGIPMQKSNPKIGHFPYAWENTRGSDKVILQITRGISCDDIIAAHAVVSCGDNEETAWAKCSSEKVFVVKSKVTVNDPAQYGDSTSIAAITGVPGTSGDFCSILTYFPIMESLGETIDLVYHNDGVTVIGHVTLEAIEGGKVRFTFTTDQGVLDYTHLFIGSVLELNNMGICDHWDYPYKKSSTTGEVVLEVPLGTTESECGEFGGSRWGWYVNYCPDC